MDGDCVSRLGESKFCGDEIPSKFESTTNRLCVKFFSDDAHNNQGFSASYDAISFTTQQIGKLAILFGGSLIASLLRIRCSLIQSAQINLSQLLSENP